MPRPWRADTPSNTVAIARDQGERYGVPLSRVESLSDSSGNVRAVSVSPWSQCTAQEANGSFCEQPSLPNAPIPICLEHAAQVYRFVNDRAEDAINAAHRNPALQVLAMAGALLDCGRDREWADKSSSVVYYLRVGELIKIGRTIHLDRRMNGYPPGAEILATEPGGSELESLRLDQFGQHLRHRREWFTPDPELLAHINALRNANGEHPVRA